METKCSSFPITVVIAEGRIIELMSLGGNDR